MFRTAFFLSYVRLRLRAELAELLPPIFTGAGSDFFSRKKVGKKKIRTCMCKERGEKFRKFRNASYHAVFAWLPAAELRG